MKKFLAHLLLILFAYTGSAQSRLDSLLEQEKNAKTDAQKLQVILRLVKEKLKADDTSGVAERIAASDELIRYNDDLSRYSLLGAKGSLLLHRGKNKEAFDEFFRALTIARGLDSDSLFADAYFNIGTNYFYYDSYTMALRYLLQAEEYYKRTKNEYMIAVIQRQSGIIHATLGSRNEAIRLYKLSAEYWKKSGNEKSLGQIYNNLGNVYMDAMRDSADAMFYYSQSLMLRTKNNDIRGIGQVYNNIGTLMFNFGHYQEALEHFTKGEDFRKRGGAPQSGLIESGINIGKTLYKLGRIAEARKRLETELNVCGDNMVFGELKRRALEYLKDIYLDAHEYQLASNAMKEYYIMRDSMFNREKTTQLVRTSLNAEFEKRLLEDSLRNAEKQRQALVEKQKEEAVQAEKDKRQRLILIFLSTGLLILVAVAFLLYKRNEEKKRTNSIITQQRDELKTKQTEITDSINYAKRIQEAILPEKELKFRMFPDSFILFMPRDIVSGDFYWFAERDGKKLVAAVDCTGHGVPGAFMSMIGNAFLNEIVNEKGTTQPAVILDQLRTQVIRSLKQTGAAGENKDGMDIALCVIDEKKNTLEFSGANNPLWLVRNGAVTELRPDKQPIGVQTGELKNFTSQVVPLQKGDRIYIFTDGYADQFGGPKGKKFKYKPMQEMLLALNDKKMSEQESLLRTRISEWKGDLEQVDDILVIGIRV